MGKKGIGAQFPVLSQIEAWYPQQQTASKNPKASTMMTPCRGPQPLAERNCRIDAKTDVSGDARTGAWRPGSRHAFPQQPARFETAEKPRCQGRQRGHCKRAALRPRYRTPATE